MRIFQTHTHTYTRLHLHTFYHLTLPSLCCLLRSPAKIGGTTKAIMSLPRKWKKIVFYEVTLLNKSLFYILLYFMYTCKDCNFTLVVIIIILHGFRFQLQILPYECSPSSRKISSWEHLSKTICSSEQRRLLKWWHTVLYYEFLDVGF